MTQLSVGVNAKNQITNSGFSYDLAGNLLADGVSSYAYDGESRIKTLNGTGAAYIYDGNGQRVRKQVGSDTTDYIQFGGQPIAERKANGDWSDYIYAGSRRLARADSYEDRLHIYGTECNCGFQWYQFKLPSAGGLAGYTIRQGDLLMWRQAEFTASGGLNMTFTDGGAETYGVLFDQDGYDINTDGLHSVWHYRRVNMNLEAGRTVSLLTLSVNGTLSGRWDLYFNDIVLVSQDGTVHPIYTRETGISLAGFGSSGMTGTGYEVNHDTGDGPISQWVATAFYHGDHLGSARLTTSENGYPTWSSTFLPFGQEWNPQVTVNHYKFTSYERDGESSNDYAMARYVSSQYGRFLMPDPLSGDAGDPQTLNRYSYVRNNPTNMTDPSGLWPCDGDCGGGGIFICFLCGGGNPWAYDGPVRDGPQPPSYTPPSGGTDPNPRSGDPSSADPWVMGCESLGMPCGMQFPVGGGLSGCQYGSGSCGGGIYGLTDNSGTIFTLPGFKISLTVWEFLQRQKSTVGAPHQQPKPAPKTTRQFLSCVATELLQNFVGVGNLDPLVATTTLHAGMVAVIRGAKLVFPPWVWITATATCDAVQVAKSIGACKQ